MDLATLLPAGGIAGTLAIVIVYLLNSNRLDRAERRLERAEDQKRIADLRADYDKQLAEMRARLDALETEVDHERRLRMTAEALAASERIRAETAEYRLAMLTGQVTDDPGRTRTSSPRESDPSADPGAGRRGLPGGAGVDDVPGHP